MFFFNTIHITTQKGPIEIIKNKEPAWAWVMPRSFSMVGISGAEIYLPGKMRKKRAAGAVGFHMFAPKGSGIGQSLSTRP
jgi:hypothetical protein